MIVTQQLKNCGIKISLLPGVNHLREAASQPVIAGRGLAGSFHHWVIYTNMELILNIFCLKLNYTLIFGRNDFLLLTTLQHIVSVHIMFFLFVWVVGKFLHPLHNFDMNGPSKVQHLLLNGPSKIV